MNRLIEMVFCKVGRWNMVNGSLECDFDENYNDVTNNLYAFVCGDDVMYVGKTTKLLQECMYHYANPKPTQQTYTRNNINIKHMLEKNRCIDIFVFDGTKLIMHNKFYLSFSVDIIKDLMIGAINPEWNIVGKRKS